MHRFFCEGRSTKGVRRGNQPTMHATSCKAVSLKLYFVRKLTCFVSNLVLNFYLASHISHPLDKNREDFFIFLSNEPLKHKESKGVSTS